MIRISLALATLAVATPASAGSLVVVAAPRNPVVTNPQALFRPNDPQLVGRLVSLDGPVPTVDGEPVRCDRPAVTRSRTTPAKLFPLLFPPRTAYGRRHQAYPRDFGLSLASGAPLTATVVRCPAARGPRASYLVAAWFPLAGGRTAFWQEPSGDHLLLLRPTTGPVRASFNCAKARTPSERTTCGDRLLAGWDESVAKAYAMGAGSEAEQRTWLAERDKCGADKACLHESMANRVGNLLR